MQTTKALGGRSARRIPPPEAETLLFFGCLMEAANLPAFYYVETQKTHAVCMIQDHFP